MRTSSISSRSEIVFVRKGGRINLRVEKPGDFAACRLGDTREHFSARPMLRLLEFDEVLASDAANQCSELVV